MYFIALFLFILLFISIISGFSIISLSDFVNVLSLIIPLLLSVPILVASGLWKDMLRSFKVINKKFKFTKQELLLSYEAVSFFIKLLINSTILATTTQFIVVLHILSDPASLGPEISTILLMVFYTTIFNFILFNIKSILKVRIIEKNYIEDVELVKDSDIWNLNDEETKKL